MKKISKKQQEKERSLVMETLLLETATQFGLNVNDVWYTNDSVNTRLYYILTKNKNLTGRNTILARKFFK